MRRVRRSTCCTRSTSTSRNVLDIDLDNARSVFESSTDFTVGLEEEFAILDRETLTLAQRYEGLRGRRRRRPGARRRGRRRADLLRDRDPLRTRGDLLERNRSAARAPAEAVRARTVAGARARRNRNASVGRLPGSADHRHRALPPGRAGSQIRGMAQQHVLAACPRRRPRCRSSRTGVRSPAGAAAQPAGDLRELAVPGRA